MSFSPIITIYLTALPYCFLIGYDYFLFEVSPLMREIFLLYTINIFHFICGSQWALSSQTLGSSSKIFPLIFVIAGTVPMIIMGHGEVVSSSLLLSVLYVLQLGYDLSSEISYCSKTSYKVARAISTALVLYSLAVIIV